MSYGSCWEMKCSGIMYTLIHNLGCMCATCLNVINYFTCQGEVENIDCYVDPNGLHFKPNKHISWDQKPHIGLVIFEL